MNKNFWLRTESNPCNSVMGARVFWTIENFMDLKDLIGESILSPSFRVKHSGSKETKWQIQLYPRGDIASIAAHKLPGGDHGHVSVFLRGTSDIKKDHARVHVSIVDCHLNRIHEKELPYLPEKVAEEENMCYGDSTAFQRRDLFLCEDDLKLPGESLTLELKIDVSWDAEDEEFEDDCQSDKAEAIKKENHDSITKSKEEAIKDFGKMFENKEFCDLEIDCGGKVFSCHQNILSARSPVFSTMLKIEMKESDSGKVSIEDINQETMFEMLYFIYTGLVNDSALTETSDVVELLFAADKYQLDTLKDICQDKLRSILDAENAIEFLILGEKYQAAKLKDSAMMEIVHLMPKIADTEDYQKLVDYPNLALEIPKAMFK